MRRWIRTAVDRLVWGARDDPLEVVRGVVEQVGADSGDELLPALAASLRSDLRLDFVAIDVRTSDGWRREASLGPPTTYERIVELDQHGDVVGRLVVGWEYGPSLRARDEHVLDELVGPLGAGGGMGAAGRRPAPIERWRSSRHARRSAAVCGATCTTGSGRR